MSKVTYQINASLSTTQGLTGFGEEWIVDAVSGEIIARFWNGNFVHSSLTLSQGSAALMEESTLVLPSEAA